jgi:hypothetical protein
MEKVLRRKYSKKEKPGFLSILKDNFPARPPIVGLRDAKNKVLLATRGAKI